MNIKYIYLIILSVICISTTLISLIMIWAYLPMLWRLCILLAPINCALAGYCLGILKNE